MPEVNLLHNTETPDPLNQKKKPVPPPEFPLNQPPSGGVRKFIQAILGRNKPVPPVDPSRMGIGGSRKDQRILNEKKSSRPAIVPLPDADEVFDVNLLSEELISRNRPRQQLIKLSLVAAAAVLVVGLIYAVIELAQRSVTTQITQAREELTKVKADIAGTREDQALIAATVKKLTAVKSLIDRHIQWTKFFAAVETYTLRQVRFGTAFSGDINGSFTLAASTDTFESLAKQYLLYQRAVEKGDFISNFTISSATRVDTDEGAKVSFSIGLQALPDTFLSDQPTTIPDAVGGSKKILSATDFLLAVCYLQGSQADLAAFPATIQNALLQLVQDPTLTSCQDATITELGRIQTAIQTDADEDGLNSLLEQLMDTSDSVSDTDTDSQTDLSEFNEQWQSEQ